MEWISDHAARGKFYHVYDYPFEDTDGTLLVLEISIDITEQRHAEEETRLLAEMTANITEGASLVRVGDGTVVYANERFEEMFGYGPGELVGMHISEINAPSDDGKSATEVFVEISGVFNRDGRWTGEISNVKKDGTAITTYLTRLSAGAGPYHPFRQPAFQGGVRGAGHETVLRGYVGQKRAVPGVPDIRGF